MAVISRLLITLVAMGVAAFSAFGFLASFEPGLSGVWKVVYAVVFVAALIGGLLPWTRPVR
jgi:hypothetical protein